MIAFISSLFMSFIISLFLTFALLFQLFAFSASPSAFFYLSTTSKRRKVARARRVILTPECSCSVSEILVSYWQGVDKRRVTFLDLADRKLHMLEVRPKDAFLEFTIILDGHDNELA